MFILRKITGNGIEINMSLGCNYTLVTEERNESEFKKTAKNHYGDNYEDDISFKETYAFIANESGEMLALFKKQENYIMTSKGQTFANISYRI